MNRVMISTLTKVDIKRVAEEKAKLIENKIRKVKIKAFTVGSSNQFNLISANEARFVAAVELDLTFDIVKYHVEDFVNIKEFGFTGEDFCFVTDKAGFLVLRDFHEICFEDNNDIYEIKVDNFVP